MVIDVKFKGFFRKSLEKEVARLLKAFEEYRLLKTLEKKIGKEKVMQLLHENGVKGRREYPRDAKKHNEFIKEIRNRIFL